MFHFQANENRAFTKRNPRKTRELRGQSCRYTVEHVRKTAPKIYSHELVNLVFELPYCRIQNLTEREIAGRQTVSVYLKELVKLEIRCASMRLRRCAAKTLSGVRSATVRLPA